MTFAGPFRGRHRRAPRVMHGAAFGHYQLLGSGFCFGVAFTGVIFTIRQSRRQPVGGLVALVERLGLTPLRVSLRACAVLRDGRRHDTGYTGLVFGMAVHGHRTGPVGLVRRALPRRADAGELGFPAGRDGEIGD